MERYEVVDTLYANPTAGVTVYRATQTDSQRTVCVKKIVLESNERLNEMLQEARNMTIFQHPGICQLLDLHVSEAEGETTILLVMELLSKDLNNEVISRRVNYLYWTEEELWRILEEVTMTLTYLQGKGLAHRDIKPHNLFLTSDGHIKLGDFGSSSFSPLDTSTTIQGTPLYLSPKLRSAYKRMLDTPDLITTRHNVFKSDVFSLGVTMMHLVRLESPEELMGLKGLEGKIHRAVEGINIYSEGFKAVLAAMMEVKEGKRPDPVQLLAIVRGHRGLPPSEVSDTRCMHCKRYMGRDSVLTVPLPCDHSFCSKDCFCVSVTIQENTHQRSFCPCCEAPIPRDMIESIRKEREESLQERIQSICSECKQSRPIMEITQCPHQYCWDCVQFWKEKYKTKPSECPKCGRPLKLSAIRWMKSGCSLL